MLEFSKTRISEPALDILKSIDIKDNLVYLNSGDIERKLYLEVSKIFEYLKGSWIGGKTNAFSFNYNPTSNITKTIDISLVPDKNPTAYFPTPQPVIDRVLEIARLDYDYGLEWNILEPSAGGGAFAEAIRNNHPLSTIDTVEYLSINQEILKEKKFNPYCGDFMEFNIHKHIQYSSIVMNPPFSVKGDKLAYITHIRHAFDMLNENGMLTAIVPTGFLHNSDKKSKDFFDFVISHGDIEMLPPKSFKDSGTNIDTAIISIEKKYWKTVPLDDYVNHFSFNLFVSIDNNQKLSLNLHKLKGKSKEEKIDFITEAIQYFSETVTSFPLSQMDAYLEDLNGMLGDRVKDTLF